MRINRWIVLAIVAVILISIPAWLFNFQVENGGKAQSQTQSKKDKKHHHSQKSSNKGSKMTTQNNREVMIKILAQDMSLTTSLFIHQLASQLDKWAQTDLSNKDMKNRFEQELREHPHIQALGYIRNGRLHLSKGDLKQDIVQVLMNRTDKKDYYSDPYTRENEQYMLMAKQMKPKEWMVGEINLSFVKKFVGQVASVADANGNFFIAAGDKEVKWRNEHQPTPDAAAEEVPELGWKIVVQSEDDNQKAAQKHYHEKQAVVRFKQNVDVSKWLKEHQQIKLVKNGGPFYVLAHDSLKADDFIKLLKKEKQVESAERNYIFTKQAPRVQRTTEELPNDEFFQPYQWNLSQIQTEQGWQITEGAKDVIIGILDTGVDPNHQDLKDKLLKGYNAFDDSSKFDDEHGHGTHVAGVTAASTNNLRGIAGISWYNPILPIKVLDQNGEGSLFEIASGIHWAVDNGAKVINMSLGDAEDSPILYEAIKYAYDHDVVLIAASGNDNISQPMYPAGYKEVLAVSAVDQNQDKAQFSNYGNHIDVAAPGENIPSLYIDNQYVFMSGTSMAAPHVTGLAGLIRSMRPDLTNTEVMEVIRRTADDLGEPGYDPYFGYGQINISKALEYIQNHEEIPINEKEKKEQQEQPTTMNNHTRRENWLTRLINLFQ